VLTAASLVCFAGATCLRVMRAAWRTPPRRAVEMLAVFIVASVFDIARALALVSPAAHRGVRPPAATAAP